MNLLGLGFLGREKYVFRQCDTFGDSDPSHDGPELKYSSSDHSQITIRTYKWDLKYTSNLLAKFRFEISRGHSK